MIRGYADAPQTSSFGLVFFGDALKFVIVDRFGFARDAVIKNFVAETGKVQRMPCVRCPPCERFMPRIASPY